MAQAPSYCNLGLRGVVHSGYKSASWGRQQRTSFKSCDFANELEGRELADPMILVK